MNLCRVPRRYVPDEYVVCGTLQNYTDSEGEVQFVQVEECPGDSSFYTWDALLGINIDLVFLAVDTVLFMAILVGMDSGFIQRHLTEAKYNASMFLRVT